ncbi:DUF1294 domain-containing protein [Psychrobacillus psychrodurans]|uniref:DUF1294 domain-containing protein n=1 Tax=Psychrobacillus psychrodurans TaxID=126157 RepID=UPI0008EE7CF4|nr:DUF1294 domain-containing protein [Psychrobacillus psychrodurans]MCZ8541753.1 DUF1294 domain-containing protein [Psychrobacillus psychrodurans]SFN00876.1 Uncharacterized membrane protein YsdA, DUF1294 family [Psychrobacillus psychrodurans]
MTNVILIFIFIMSIIAFFVMGYDKSQARKQGQRISERTLWTFALLGGGIGAYIGMQMFRHKTKHTNFRVGFLMLMILYAFLIFYILTTDSSIIA